MNEVIAFNTLIAFLVTVVIVGGYATACIVRRQSNRASVIIPFFLATLFLSMTGFYGAYSISAPYGSFLAWYFAFPPFFYLLMVSSVFNWTNEKQDRTDIGRKLSVPVWKYLAPLTFALVGLAVFYLSKGYVGNDEGSYVYEMHLISQGLVPFKDFISRAPAEIGFFWLFSQIFGASILSLKAFNALVIALIGLVSYHIIRRFQKPHIALIGSLAIIITPCFLLTKLVFSTTGLSTLLVLVSCLLVAVGKRYADVLAGAVVALAVFTREINALFVLGLLLMLFYVDKRALRGVIVGGLCVAVPVFGFFGAHIGIGSAFDLLLGLSHVGVDESQPSIGFSLTMVWFFFVSMLPFLVLFMTSRKRSVVKQDVPLLIWVVLMSLFYGWYMDKRAFMLSYGSEFVPLIGVLVFSLVSFDRGLYLKKHLVRVSVVVGFLLLLAPYALVDRARGDSVVLERPFPLDRLIGSGIPSPNFEEMRSVIGQHARPGDIVFVGNLAFAYNGLSQFMNISRPMAYEGSAKIYELYGAPSRESIINAIINRPPQVIVNDHHMAISFLPDIQEFIEAAYTVEYSDDFATVFVRR
jgi:hypothetical protein